MAPSSGELWGHHLMPQRITVDCLLPNGVIIPLNCYRDSLLEHIKSELWREARDYPLYQLLKDKESYKFVAITQDAEREEFYDEGRRLCDLRLFQPVLKVAEPQGNKEEKIANSKISMALGVSVQEFDEIKEDEIIGFRRDIFVFVKECFQNRTESGPECQALYQYPPEIENTSVLPPALRAKLDHDMVAISVWSIFKKENKLENHRYPVWVPLTATPSDIIRETICKTLGDKDKEKSIEERREIAAEAESAYVLKVAGIDQYLLKQCPITQYKYIRACIARGRQAHLMIMNRKTMYEYIPEASLHTPSFMRKAFNPALPSKTVILWSSEKTSFRVSVTSATYVNVKEADLVYVRVGLFNGTEPLCQIAETKRVSSTHLRWDEWLQFEVHTIDLPRAVKLCLSVCSGKRRNKSQEDNTMLCWCNINLFDYNGYLVSGRQSLNFRLPPRDFSDLLFPLGPTGSNPVRDSPCLQIDFERSSSTIVYPSMDDFTKYAGFLEKLDDPKANFNKPGGYVKPQADISPQEQQLLKDILNRDPLAEISEQEKGTLWKLRRHCMDIPDILPRLLDAVKWNSRDDVTHMYMLLQEWRWVSPLTALELLDCKYGDPMVRRLAVQWLDAMSDEDLSQYLLQLVQTLKYEPYLDNPLSRLLLRRALLNRKIGHIFFWHLRCELHSQSYPIVRFGLLLEAFCRGLGPYLKDLIKQVEALDKLTTLTFSLKERGSSSDNARFLMRQPDYAQSLSYFQSPLENNVIFGELDAGECRVMNSAKKPLWLVWQNPDQLASIQYNSHAIIFKNGDDLRQDMLTLQVIRIMDHIWRMEGMDLRMTPYSCLATGNQVGIIEVVRNSKTVFDIQKQASRLASMQIDSSQLFKWIRDHNNANADSLEQAIQSFTLSCAGYCVATFILGIGDRHPNNIMVCESGQIFHIDFGHFLGHFKKKFGVSRERVPFVLTEDFLLVISKGKENPKKSKEFAKFKVKTFKKNQNPTAELKPFFFHQELCGEAYLALRQHANLLITLFTMMLPAGIAELQSIDNIGYLRQTLAVEKSKEEALEYFKAVFYDAYEGAYTTKLDWFCHSAKRGF